MKINIIENITDYMNARSHKHFETYTVLLIRRCVDRELKNRKNSGLKINSRTVYGKSVINNRIGKMVNDRLEKVVVNTDDIKLYKRCLIDEYSNRTGNCAWGFKNTRIRLGYDPDTGKEVEDNIEF